MTHVPVQVHLLLRWLNHTHVGESVLVPLLALDDINVDGIHPSKEVDPHKNGRGDVCVAAGDNITQMRRLTRITLEGRGSPTL